MIFTISGCANKSLQYVNHPELITPTLRPLPKYTRDLVDCGYTAGKWNNPEDRELCYRIKEREMTLKEHIDDLEELIGLHNVLLSGAKR